MIKAQLLIKHFKNPYIEGKTQMEVFFILLNVGLT